MRPSFRLSLIVLAAPALAVAAAAGAAAQGENPPPPPPHAAPPPPPGMGGGPHWADEREALLDAKLGGLRAGLRLNPEQEKLWGPFEAAVREAAQMRMHHMMEMMHRREGPGMMGPGEDEEEGPGGSPIDRLEAMANRMSEGADALSKIVDAAKPLYAGLDETQKRDFDFLSREMLMLGHERGMGWGHPGPGWGHGHRGWGPHHGDEGQDEED